MNGRFIRTGIVLGLFLVLSGTTVQFSATNAQQEQVYLALGDSIPAGIASSLPRKRSFPAVLNDLLERQQDASGEPGATELINLSEPGETVQSFIDDGQLAAAIDTINGVAEANQGLRTVTLTLGGNDILNLWDVAASEREADLQRFREAYQHVIDELAGALEGREVNVVVTTYYDLTEGNTEVTGSDSWWLNRFNEVITEVASGAGFAVTDLEPVFRDRIAELTWFPADVHPNNEGHEAIAHAIWRTLEYDQSAPGVTITRPEPGEAVRRAPTVHAEVDDDVQLDTVELYANDELVDELIYVSSVDAYVGLWDGREHASADAELTVVATDLAGNESRDAVSISLPDR